MMEEDGSMLCCAVTQKHCHVLFHYNYMHILYLPDVFDVKSTDDTS